MYEYKIFPNIPCETQSLTISEKTKEMLKDPVLDSFGDFIDKIETKDGRIRVYINHPIEVIFNDDLCFTVLGEIGILGADKISLDGKEIHLNSRNCKQLREFRESTIEEILLKIKPLKELESQEIDLNKFKEEIKKEIIEELNLSPIKRREE